MTDFTSKDADWDECVVPVLNDYVGRMKAAGYREEMKSFTDPMSRQISEGVNIRRSGAQAINSKLDFYQPSTYKVRRQVDHG